MNFYGVGTRFSGSEPFLEDCLKYDFWCMGDSEMKYFNKYKSLKVGDILVAKRYYTKKSEHIAIMDIEAIGIVWNLGMPEGIPERYRTNEKYGVTVLWVKVFEKPVSLTSENYILGGNKLDTIFKMSYEKDKEIISKIKEIMKYDYKPEV